MPRMTKAVPAYRHHKGSDQAVVSINKKVVYLGKWKSADSKQAYDRLIAEWLAGQRRTVQAIAENSHTLNEIILAYWKYAQGYYVKNGKPTGEQGAIKLALRELRGLYGRSKANAFDPLMLEAVRTRMVNRKLALKTINDGINRIIRMFRWAAVKGWVPGSLPQTLRELPPLKAGRSEAKETNPIKPVPDVTVAQTLPHLPAVVRDMVKIQRLSGMRPQDVCNMRPQDLNTSGKAWVYRPGTHKMEHKGRERVIVLGPKAIAIVQPYLTDRPVDAAIFSPHESEEQRKLDLHAARKTPKDQGNVPGSNRKTNPKRRPGGCYTTGSYRHAVARACDKAFPVPSDYRVPAASELPEADVKRRKASAKEWQKSHRWTPNQLRHALATQLRSSHGLEVSRITLGHSAADVTERHYAEVDLTKLIDVMLLVG